LLANRHVSPNLKSDLIDAFVLSCDFSSGTRYVKPQSAASLGFLRDSDRDIELDI